MNDNPSIPFLEVSGIRKVFRIGATEIHVLRDVSFSVEQGTFLTLLGASGSGKTTLLDIIGSLSHPDAGEVRVRGVSYDSLSSRALVRFRRKNIGFVFQSYHILPELNILENVMLPALLDGRPAKESKIRAQELLEKVGLSHRTGHRPNELSGGEQQRAAIARALINEPELLLADEPTGNLDSVTGQGILDLFTRIRGETNVTILMVTHDRHVADLADRTVELRDGVVFTDAPVLVQQEV